MNCMYVLRASIVDVNHAEISSYFHDMRVGIQHAEEKTQDHPNDEPTDGEDGVRRTATKLFCESMDDEGEMLTTDGELYTRHRPRSVASRRETAGNEEQATGRA